MVLQDLGRRINAAVSNLTREQNLDEKVGAFEGAPRRRYGIPN
jgi:signal recognition particle subunit SRP54